MPSESELLSQPMVDLVDAPWNTFHPLLRGEALPPAAVLEALDVVIRLRAIRALARMDEAHLISEVDGIRRLVPHDRRAAIDAWCEKPWSTRWLALADLLDLAVETRRNLNPAEARRLAGAEEILSLALSRAEIAERLPVRLDSLDRVLSVLEANGLIRKETP